MKRPYQIAAAFFLLFATFIARESLRLRVAVDRGPGPGLLPLFLSVALGALALTMFLQASRTKKDATPRDFWGTRSSLLRIATVIGLMVGLALLLEPLGFRLSFLLFYFLVLTTLNYRRWIVTALVAIGGSFGVYQLFTDVFRIPLPIGFLGV